MYPDRRDNYICVECRYHRSGPGKRCPKGHDLINMGRNFKVPRKRDDRAWKAVEQVARDHRGFGGSLRSPWSYGRTRPEVRWRTHRTMAELRQIDVPVRKMPGVKKGQYYFQPGSLRGWRI